MDQAHETLEADGYILLQGPYRVGDVPQVLARFGHVDKNLDGAVANPIQHRSEFERYRFSGSANSIGAHTEQVLLPVPPRYCALLCEIQAKCGGGKTRLYDMRRFLRTLPELKRQALKNTILRFSCKVRPTDVEFDVRHFPMLDQVAGRQIVRFSHNQFYFGDTNGATDGPDTDGVPRPEVPEAVRSIIVELSRRCLAESIDIHIPEGGLLIWDNHRLLHWRDGYRDKRRRLQRFLVQDEALRGVSAGETLQ